MVLGLRSTKNKNGSVCINYVVHIQEIKPWPPSQSLKAVRSVVLLWENGDSSSGATSPVAPSVGSTAAEGKIEFSQSFRLEVLLNKEISVKGNTKGMFQKNLLEFNLYEPRRDKSKGQHLGTAVIDLAAHGIVKEAVTISVPVDSKRNFRNTAQPLLYVKIQLFDKNSASSSYSGNLVGESPRDDEEKESVSAMMTEEYAEETEIASFTDDDISSQSSVAISSTAEANADFSLHSSPDNDGRYKDAPEDWKESCMQLYNQHLEASSNVVKAESSSCDTSINKGQPLVSESEIITRNRDAPIQKTEIQETTTNQGNKEMVMQETMNKEYADTTSDVSKLLVIRSRDISRNQATDQNAGIIPKEISDDTEEASNNEIEVCHLQETGLESNIIEQVRITEDTASAACLESASFTQDNCEENIHKIPVDMAKSKQDSVDEKNRIIDTGENIQNATLSTRLQSYHSGSISTFIDEYNEDIKEIDIREDENEGIGMKQNISSNAGKLKHAYRVKRNSVSNNKEQELMLRMALLEAELREAAAIEISLYSIVAEHGSSVNKVRTPCRRLSRLYHHTLEKEPVERRACTAKNIASGLFLVAKACGNDVARLTFWLSNIVVLRVTISGMVGHKELPSSVGSFSTDKSSEKVQKSKPSQWKPSTSPAKKVPFSDDFDVREDSHMFLPSLENVETWVFNRIVESVWWQALTPCMQSVQGNKQKMRSNSQKIYAKSSSMGDQHEASINAWKRAFEDASGRLCPVRTGGHQCGCLPLLAKLVMEQCVVRLDIAMFNAILRDSNDDISMDPLSDPIYDTTVLPISCGDLTFGLGAELKNAIGSWSRCLSELFGMDNDDDDDLSYNKNEQIDVRTTPASFKPFSLLNALSDLLMIPKDMLLDKSIRQEAFPEFSSSLIKQIVSNFQPDDFYPYPVPPNVLESLDSEESPNTGKITSIPCSAYPTVYSPPSADSIRKIVGEIQLSSPSCRSSSLVRKCHTSDDELDELDSPLSSITGYSFLALKDDAKVFSCSNSIRYQLLREIWKND